MGRPETRVPGHCVVCIGLDKKVREVLDCLGFLDAPGYEHVLKGVCPNCGGPFKLLRTTCRRCGHFEVETFTWRPKA